MKSIGSKSIELGGSSRVRAVVLADIALSIFYLVLVFAWLSLSPDSYGWGYGLARIWHLVLLTFILRLATLVMLVSARRYYVLARIVASILLLPITFTTLNSLGTLGGFRLTGLLVLIMVWDIVAIFLLSHRSVRSEFKPTPNATHRRRISYSRPTTAAEARTASSAEMFDEEGYVISAGTRTSWPDVPSQSRIVMPETSKICPLCGTTNPYTASNCVFCLSSLEELPEQQVFTSEDSLPGVST